MSLQNGVVVVSWLDALSEIEECTLVHNIKLLSFLCCTWLAKYSFEISSNQKTLLPAAE